MRPESQEEPRGSHWRSQMSDNGKTGVQDKVDVRIQQPYPL